MRTTKYSLGFGFENKNKVLWYLLRSPFSVFSFVCVASAFSVLSIFSVASVGSVFSIGSVGSFMAIGCVHKMFQQCDETTIEFGNQFGDGLIMPMLISGFFLAAIVLLAIDWTLTGSYEKFFQSKQTAASDANFLEPFIENTGKPTGV